MVRCLDCLLCIVLLTSEVGVCFRVCSCVGCSLLLWVVSILPGLGMFGLLFVVVGMYDLAGCF